MGFLQTVLKIIETVGQAMVFCGLSSEKNTFAAEQAITVTLPKNPGRPQKTMACPTGFQAISNIRI
jgi:hypothetical protein